MRPAYAAVCIFLLAALVGGCSSEREKQSIERENSRLRWIIKLYVRAGQEGQSNTDSEFKQFFAALDAGIRENILASAGVQSTDELFISERDGKPFVIFYGPPPKGVASGVIAFEQEGVGGKRYVGFALGVVEEVDEARFNELIPKAALSQK